MRKRLLLLLFFTCFASGVFSQSFYEAKWTIGDINYTALIEFFTLENINVRVKYKVKGDYRVAKYKAKGRYDSANDYYLISGYKARIIYPYDYKNPTTGYSPDNFFFTNRDDNNVYQDLNVYDKSDINSDGTVDYLWKATYKALKPSSDFTEQYIYSFFDKHEPEYATYINLIAVNNLLNTNSTSSTSNSSYSYNYDKLYFKNECNYNANLLIRYKNLDGEWVTKGWYELEPNQNAYVEDTQNTTVYWYAEDATGTWSGKHKKTFRNKTYGFREWKITDKKWGIQTKRLTCESSLNESETTTTLEGSVKIHLIFAADVNDPLIGYSTKEDMNDITNLLKKAAKELDVEFQSHRLYGDYFDKNSINSTLESLSIKNNDVIIFYYSGHGYNNTNAYNKFPEMSLDGEDASLEEIHAKLKYKNARLTLTIGDLCNSIPRARSRTKNQTEIPFKSGFLFDTQKLRKLFIEAKGNLISTSSRKGQWSYTMGNDSNGHFTNAFIDSFTKEASKISNYKGSWISLFNNAYKEAKYRTRDNQNQDGSYGQNGTNTNNLRF